ncbi:MAG: hypothetical protein J6Y89_05900 [Lachnospiraceae bacterium]|nr:hypothetical protein [Lachnospiraceae bacterium]
MLNQFISRLGGFQNMMGQFNQFANSFHGNPEQQVQQLLNTGRMTQQQFNDLYSAARQIQNMMGGGRS